MKKMILLLCVLFAAAAAQAMDVNVTDFGAVPDRTTDCTAAFQSAIDACFDSKGGSVFVPTGYFCVKGHLTVKDGVVLKGTYVAPPTNGPGNRTHQDADMKGSVIMAYAGKNDPDGKPFITLTGNNAGVQGLIIYYPEWLQETVPPIPYSPCISGENGNNQSVINCNLLNPYVGIKFNNSHRMHISGVQGYPIKTGISIDCCYDICRIENIHFWPYNVIYRADDPYCKWINQNGTAFEFARTDWQYCTNTFCFGYNAGYRFIEKQNGGCNGSFMCIGADSCVNAVSVEAIQNMGLAITNGEFVGRWSSTDSCTVDIKPNVRGKVGLVNCTFWGPIDTCIKSGAPSGVLSVSGCNFVNWNINGDDSPAISLREGTAVITGNTFADNTVCVEVRKNVKNAIVSDNLAKGIFAVKNDAGIKADIRGNMPVPFEPSKENLVNYSLDFQGDAEAPYIKGFNGAESRFGGMRWSDANAKISLPVLPETDYTLYMYLNVPRGAVSEASGIYQGDKKLIALDKEQVKTLSAPVKTGKGQKTLDLDIKVKGWRPMDLIEGSTDYRTLGIGVMQVKLVSKKDGKVFNFNRQK